METKNFQIQGARLPADDDASQPQPAVPQGSSPPPPGTGNAVPNTPASQGPAAAPASSTPPNTPVGFTLPQAATISLNTQNLTQPAGATQAANPGTTPAPAAQNLAATVPVVPSLAGTGAAPGAAGDLSRVGNNTNNSLLNNSATDAQFVAARVNQPLGAATTPAAASPASERANTTNLTTPRAANTAENLAATTNNLAAGSRNGLNTLTNLQAQLNVPAFVPLSQLAGNGRADNPNNVTQGQRADSTRTGLDAFVPQFMFGSTASMPAAAPAATTTSTNPSPPSSLGATGPSAPSADPSLLTMLQQGQLPAATSLTTNSTNNSTLSNSLTSLNSLGTTPATTPTSSVNTSNTTNPSPTATNASPDSNLSDTTPKTQVIAPPPPLVPVTTATPPAPVPPTAPTAPNPSAAEPPPTPAAPTPDTPTPPAPNPPAPNPPAPTPPAPTPTAPNSPSVTGPSATVNFENVQNGLVKISGQCSELASQVSIQMGSRTVLATITGSTWSYTVRPEDINQVGETDLGKLNQALNTLSVTQTVDGVKSAATQVAFTVDTVAPDAPVLHAVTGDNVISVAEAAGGVVLTGTRSSDAVQVRVTIDGQTYNATNTAGGWSLALDATQLQAWAGQQKTISIVQLDAFGNASAPASQVISVEAPNTAPTNLTMAEVDIINAATRTQGVVLAGTADSNATQVILHIGTRTITVDVTAGQWSYALDPFNDFHNGAPGSTATDKLNQDSNTILLAQVVNGVTSSTISQTIVVDTIAPDPLLPNMIMGSGPNEEILWADVQAGLPLTGKAEAGAKVEMVLNVDGPNPVTRTTLADSNGNWSFTLQPSDFTEQGGLVPVTLRQVDKAGNISPPTSGQIVALPPVNLVTVDPFTADNIINKDESQSNSLTLHGGLVDFSAVERLEVRVGETVWVATIGENNKWSVHLSPFDVQNIYQNPLAYYAKDQKIIELVLTKKDGTQMTLPYTFGMDLVDPDAPVFDIVTGDNLVSAAEASQAVTLSGSYTVGDATHVKVRINDTVLDAQLAPNGTWSLQLSPAQMQAWQGQTLPIKVYQIDAAGNTSSSVSHDVTFAAPPPPTSAPTPAPSPDPLRNVTFNTVAEDDIVNATEAREGVLVTGQVATGAERIVLSLPNGQTRLAKIQGDTWSYTLDSDDVAALQAMGEAQHTLTVQAYNGSNALSGQTSNRTIRIDVDAGSITINDITGGDNKVNLAEKEQGVIISGQLDTDTASVVVMGNAATVRGSTWSYKLTEQDWLQIGNSTEFILPIYHVDQAGNSSGVTLRSMYLDLDPPEKPVIHAVAGDNVIDKNEALSTVVMTGTNEAGAQVEVVIGNKTLSAVVSGQNWSLDLTPQLLAELGPGAKQAVVRQIDSYGNRSAEAKTLFSIQTEVPGAITIDPIGTNDILNKRKMSELLVISGTVDSGADSVTVFLGPNQTIPRTATLGANGTWSLMLSTEDQTKLSQGMNQISAQFHNAEGSSAPAERAVWVDTIANAPVINTYGNNNVIGRADKAKGVIITGTVDADAAQVLVDGQAATINGTTWSYRFNLEDYGDVDEEAMKNVLVKMIDHQGNESPSATMRLTIDTLTPSPVRIDTIEGDNKLSTNEVQDGMVIRGTCDSDAEQVYVSFSTIVGQRFAAVVNKAAKTWEYTLSAKETALLAQTLAEQGQDALGSLQVSVVQENGSRSSVETVQTLQVDVDLPGVPALDLVQDSSPADLTTTMAEIQSSQGVILNGHVEAGTTTVELELGRIGSTVTHTVQAEVSGTTWSYKLKAEDIQGGVWENDGKNYVRARAYSEEGVVGHWSDETIIGLDNDGWRWTGLDPDISLPELYSTNDIPLFDYTYTDRVDGSESGKVTYQLSKLYTTDPRGQTGDPEDLFSIDANTGVISLDNVIHHDKFGRINEYFYTSEGSNDYRMYVDVLEQGVLKTREEVVFRIWDSNTVGENILATNWSTPLAPNYVPQNEPVIGA